MKPLEVLTILDAVSVFFNVKECIFVFALDHFRINNAIENMNCQNLERVYPSKYIDKIIQLNISIPTHDYDIKNFIKDVLKLDDEESKFPNIVDNYTSLTLYSVGMIPRNIKKICSKFMFYKYILHHVITEENKDNENFFPFGDCYLHHALFSMICFQESYEPIYNIFVHSNGCYKEFITEIINIIKNKKYTHDTILYNDECKIFIEDIYSNKFKEEKFIHFLNIFIISISINENTRKKFSHGGRYLVETMSKIIQQRDIYDISTYNSNLPFTINNYDTLTNYFNRIFLCYLEFIDSKITCVGSPKNIQISFEYNCGPFSFIFHIIYENDIISPFIETTFNNLPYKNIIYKWIDESCFGLPQKTFIPHNDIFIIFDKIFNYEYVSIKQNSFKFFIKTVNMLLCQILNSISTLYARNYNIIQNLSYKNNELNKIINNIFQKNEGWCITGGIDITNR